MVENCMGGYNSCMFAYGQTGSGKTHTMLGDIEGGTRRHSVNCGMTPRVFEHLFSRIQKEKESRRDEKLKYTCKFKVTVMTLNLPKANFVPNWSPSRDNPSFGFYFLVLK
ncbi:hypothetical protein IFM89_035396, partial [Coptis chinensis]